MRAAGIALVILRMVVGVAEARPDEGVVRARALYQTGTTHYNLGEYRAALEDFTAAYRLRADPAFLFNIGQCQRQLGQPEDAARSYRAFLRESPDAPNRAEVERLIETMERSSAERRAKVVVAPVVAPVAAAPVEPVPPSPPRRSRTWLWVTLGVAAGVVVAGSAIGLGVGLGMRGGPTADTTLGTYGAVFP